MSTLQCQTIQVFLTQLWCESNSSGSSTHLCSQFLHLDTHTAEHDDEIGKIILRTTGSL